MIPPAGDFCQVCQENNALILKSVNLSKDEKQQRLMAAQQHLEFAKV